MPKSEVRLQQGSPRAWGDGGHRAMTWPGLTTWLLGGRGVVDRAREAEGRGDRTEPSPNKTQISRSLAVVLINCGPVSHLLTEWRSAPASPEVPRSVRASRAACLELCSLLPRGQGPVHELLREALPRLERDLKGMAWEGEDIWHEMTGDPPHHHVRGGSCCLDG